MTAQDKLPTCPHCGQASKLVKGQEIYPHRPDLSALNFYRCAPCDAYVGTHKGTKTALGTPANAPLRAARSRAHAAFDPIWRERKMSRTRAYAWLSRQLALPPGETHIGMFNTEQCAATVAAVERQFGTRSAAGPSEFQANPKGSTKMPKNTHWYALNAEGDIVGLGEHRGFEAASTHADMAHPGCVWVADAETARSWSISLRILLRDDEEMLYA